MNASSNHQQHHVRLGQPGPAPVPDLSARRQARADQLEAEGRIEAACAAGDAAEAAQTAAFTAVMYRAAIAEGERRAYEAMGVRRPPQPSPARPRHLAAVPGAEPELEAEP